MMLDDQELNARLRDVEIPAELGQRLLALPSGKEVAKKRTPLALAKMWLATAAAIAAVVVASRWTGETKPVTGVVSGRGENDRIVIGAKPSPRSALEVDAIGEIRGGVDRVDAKVRERTIRALSRSLLERKESAAPTLDSRQRTALIVAMADQSALELGVSPRQVVQDMSRIMERFPNTSGAKLAEQFISQLNIH